MDIESIGEKFQMGTRRIRKADGEYTLFFRKVSPFSNHHPADFVCDEAINCIPQPKQFSCTEQYYMFNKAALLRDEELMTAVLESDSPRAMKSMCSKGALRGWNDALWDQYKENVMFTGCLAKFQSCQHLRFALFLSTGSRLMECSPFDTVWGIGKDLETAMKADDLKSGRNLLGKILEEVREKLWNEEIYRDEREDIERRIRENPEYLLKAMRLVDLLYKERAVLRFQMSKRRHVHFMDNTITEEIRTIFPEWALPPPIDEDEAIRASPALITEFEKTPPTRNRSRTPPRTDIVPKLEKSNPLFGRLTISEGRPIQSKRNRSTSRDTFASFRSRESSEERHRHRKKRRKNSRTRRHRSRSRSPKNRRERRAAERRSEERREKRSRSHKKKHRHRHRSDSREERSHDRERRHRSRKSESRKKSRSSSGKHRRRRHRWTSSEDSERSRSRCSPTRNRTDSPCVIVLE